MAGPAPTTLSNYRERSAGPVHSSGWLSRVAVETLSFRDRFQQPRGELLCFFGRHPYRHGDESIRFVKHRNRQKIFQMDEMADEHCVSRPHLPNRTRGHLDYALFGWGVLLDAERDVQSFLRGI